MSQPTHRRASRAALAACLGLIMLAAASGPATAQVRFQEDRELLGLDLRQSYRTWTIDDTVTGESVVVRQYAARSRATVDVLRNLDLVLYTAGGFSEDRRAGVDRIAGLADTKLKAYGYTWDDRLAISVGVNLPTGITSLDDEQVAAVQAVSSNVLGFPMKNYGSGTELDLGVATGMDLARGVTIGGGASVLIKGSYDLDPATTFEPGAEIALTAGADWRTTGALVSLDLLYRMYGDDQLDDAGSFADGDQFETTLGGAWRADDWGVDASLRHIYKQDGEYDWVRPAAENRVENGHNLWFLMSPYYQAHDAVTVRGILDYVTVDQSQQQASGAWALGFGGGVDVRVTPRAIVALRATRLVGRNDDDTIELSGFDGMLTIRWQY